MKAECPLLALAGMFVAPLNVCFRRQREHPQMHRSPTTQSANIVLTLLEGPGHGEMGQKTACTFV
jgi:hypothetical protein